MSRLAFVSALVFLLAAVLVTGLYWLLLVLVAFVLPPTVLVLTILVCVSLIRRHWSFQARMAVSSSIGVLLLVALHSVSWDGWPCIAFPLVGLDDTEFSEDYSAVGFASVQAGMTEAEVLAAAGAPLERWSIDGTGERQGWRWARSHAGGSYRVRAVLFERGRVTEKLAEYYVD